MSLDTGTPDWSVSQQEPVANHLDMPEWVQTVKEHINDYNLEHLAVYSIDYTSWAHSDDFQLSETEVTDITNCLNNCNQPALYGNIYVTINNQKYAIHSSEYSEEHMQCSGPIDQSDKSKRMSAWICKSATYLVVGMCKADFDKDCLTSVSFLVSFIKQIEHEEEHSLPQHQEEHSLPQHQEESLYTNSTINKRIRLSKKDHVHQYIRNSQMVVK